MRQMQEQAGAAPEPGALLTTRDLQRLIKVDKSTIYRLAESGRLPALKVGRQWRFPQEAVRSWLSGDRAATPAPIPGFPDEPPGPAVPREALQAAADLLAEATGTMVVLTDLSGHPMADVAHPCGLFAALHTHPGVMERCVDGWQGLAGEVDLEPRWTPTPLGFLCARSLFRVGDRLKGMVLAGGVAPESWPPPSGEQAALAVGLGVPPAALCAHVEGVYRLSPQERDRVLRLLPKTAALVSHLAGAVAASLPPTPQPHPRTPRRSPL